jgi:hypothetical protein
VPSWEMQLLSRIIRHGQINKALEWGISDEDFLTDEGRTMFSHLLSYIADPNHAGAKLGPNSARMIWPTFEMCDDDSSTLEQLCTEVRKIRLIIDSKAAAQRVIDMADDDPIEAANAGASLFKDILQLGYTSQTDVRLTAAASRGRSRRDLIKSGVDLAKTHWPWDLLDKPAMGINEDDYIVYYGRPKSMKTWVLSYHIAHTFNAGYRPLLYTKEMLPDNILARVEACLAEVPYQDLRGATLSPEAEARVDMLHRMLGDIEPNKDIICLSGRDAPSGNDTVQWLQSKVEKYRPDIVFVDGIYLMKNSRGNKNQKDNARVRDISRDIRQMVLDTKIPVVATIQANRDAAKHQSAELDEIAFSDAIGQDATVIIRVINEKATPTIALVIGGVREYTLHGLRIHGEPATDFTEISEMSEREISSAKNKDVGEAEGGKSKEKKASERKSKDRKETDAMLRRKLRNI